jgi:hypothetical protein
VSEVSGSVTLLGPLIIWTHFLHCSWHWLGNVHRYTYQVQKRFKIGQIIKQTTSSKFRAKHSLLTMTLLIFPSSYGGS